MCAADEKKKQEPPREGMQYFFFWKPFFLFPVLEIVSAKLLWKCFSVTALCQWADYVTPDGGKNEARV